MAGPQCCGRWRIWHPSGCRSLLIAEWFGFRGLQWWLGTWQLAVVAGHLAIEACRATSDHMPLAEAPTCSNGRLAGDLTWPGVRASEHLQHRAAEGPDVGTPACASQRARRISRVGRRHLGRLQPSATCKLTRADVNIPASTKSPSTRTKGPHGAWGTRLAFTGFPDPQLNDA